MIMAIASFSGWGWWASYRDDGVEEVADGDDPGAGHGHEGDDERGFQDPAQQDELGQAERDDGHHEGEQGAHRQALVVQGQHQRHDAGGVGVQRDPDHHRDQDGEGVPGSGVLGEEVLRCPAVDGGAQCDSDQQVGPDLAQDQPDLLNAHLDPVVPGQPDGRVDNLPAQAGLEHEGLDPPFELQPAQNEPGADGDEQARADVQQGRADPEHPEQQTDRDLVDQRAGD